MSELPYFAKPFYDVVDKLHFCEETSILTCGWRVDNKHFYNLDFFISDCDNMKNDLIVNIFVLTVQHFKYQKERFNYNIDESDVKLLRKKVLDALYFVLDEISD